MAFEGVSYSYCDVVRYFSFIYPKYNVIRAAMSRPTRCTRPAGMSVSDFPTLPRNGSLNFGKIHDGVGLRRHVIEALCASIHLSMRMLLFSSKGSRSTRLKIKVKSLRLLQKGSTAISNVEKDGCLSASENKGQKPKRVNNVHESSESSSESSKK